MKVHRCLKLALKGLIWHDACHDERIKRVRRLNSAWNPAEHKKNGNSSRISASIVDKPSKLSALGASHLAHQLSFLAIFLELATSCTKLTSGMRENLIDQFIRVKATEVFGFLAPYAKG